MYASDILCTVRVTAPQAELHRTRTDLEKAGKGGQRNEMASTRVKTEQTITLQLGKQMSEGSCD